MTKTRIIALLLVLVMMLGCFAACTPSTPSVGDNPNPPPVDGGGDEEDLTFKLEYADGTLLRMATGYNNAKTGLFFDASVAGEGITLADGKTYKTGDLKPTWVEVKNVLKVDFENKYQGNSAQNEFKYWQDQLDQVDMVSGTASQLSEAGVAGKLINLADYLNDMPNFKKYLEENPIVLLSITGDIQTGAIYYSPYFDGVNDIERMPLMRVDWVAKLLDGEGDFTAEASNNLSAAVYTPYMPAIPNYTHWVTWKQSCSFII